MDTALFFDQFDSGSPIASGARWLSAAGGRVAYSIVRSQEHMPSALKAHVSALLTLDVLWGVSLVLVGMAVATLIGGPIALAVDACLAVYGLVELYKAGKQLLALGHDWLTLALTAKDEAQLDQASHLFAQFAAQGGLTLIELLVTHRVFRAANRRLTQRFPMGDLKQKLTVEEPKPQPRRKDELKQTVARVSRPLEGYGKSALSTQQQMPIYVAGGVVAVAAVVAVAFVVGSRK